MAADKKDMGKLAELFIDLRIKDSDKINNLLYDGRTQFKQRYTAIENERDTLRKALDATRIVRDEALKERNVLRTTLDTARNVRDTALKERNTLRNKVDYMSKMCKDMRTERDTANKELSVTKNLLEKISQLCTDE